MISFDSHCCRLMSKHCPLMQPHTTLSFTSVAVEYNCVCHTVLQRSPVSRFQCLEHVREALIFHHIVWMRAFAHKIGDGLCYSGSSPIIVQVIVGRWLVRQAPVFLLSPKCSIFIWHSLQILCVIYVVLPCLKEPVFVPFT